MKKLFFVLVLLFVIAGGVFADNTFTAKNFVSGEVGLLDFGARYERMLDSHWSVGGNIYFSMFLIFLFQDFGIDVCARYYPGPNWGGPTFFGLGLGYHVGDLGGDSVSGVALTPEVGWKKDVGGANKFFIQPGIKLPITIGYRTIYNPWGSDSSEFDVDFSFVPYFCLGYAF